LRQLLAERAGGAPDGAFSARVRHISRLREAKLKYQEAKSLFGQRQSAELIAEELRLAQGFLGEITGVVSSDDLLGEIFSQFCIGK